MFASFICLSTLYPKPNIEFEVRLEPFPNLTYQLDLITHQLPWESEASFKELWKQEFLKSHEDRKMLDLWTQTRDRIKLIPTKRKSLKWPIEDSLSRADSDEQVRAAGLDSSNSAEYRSQLEKVFGKTDSESLFKVTNHFEKRFREWWKKAPAVEGTPVRAKLHQLLSSDKVAKCIRQFESFYKPSFGKSIKLPFMLMYKPKFGENEPTSGQQLSRHAIVQFEPNENVERRIDVVIHEFCHFLYQSGSPKDHFALQRQFLNLNDPAAIPAFNLLNEGLATALGNGILAESVDPVRFARIKDIKLSWYAKDSIDRSAKVIFPWIKADLAAGRGMFDPDFARKFVESLKKEFGQELQSPKLFFANLRLIADSKFGTEIFGVARQIFNPAGMSAEIDEIKSKPLIQALESAPHLSTIVVLNHETWRELEKALAIKDAARSSDSMIYCWMGKSRQAPVFFLVTQDGSEIRSLMEKIAHQRIVKNGIL
jgi:hypothetical protein